MEHKIHATADALGNPTSFALTGGQAHDLDGADLLLPGIEAEALLADKAFDAEERVRAPLLRMGIIPVIPPKKNRVAPQAYSCLKIYPLRRKTHFFRGGM